MTVCGSTVTGTVSMKNSTLMVRLGDDDIGCAGKATGGSPTATGNLAASRSSHSIGATTTINNNQGASAFADAAPEIEGNHITPAVTNHNLPNTTTGAKTGQRGGL